MKRITRVAGGAALAASLVLSVNAGVAQAQAKGVFIDLQNMAAGEPDHIDPHLTGTLTGAQVSLLMFDSLTQTDYAGKLVPAAASKWSTPDAGGTWVFTVKKNKFSNGEPVLPSSFVRGFARLGDPKNASEVAYHGYIIAGFEDYNGGKGAFPASSFIADDKKMTLTVKMAKPYQSAPEVLSHPAFSPIPKSMEGASTKIEEDGTKLVGNGPYKLKKAIRKQIGGEVTLVRNSNYSGKKGSLNEIQFLISKDLDSAYNLFEAQKGQSGPIPAGKFKEATGKYGNSGTTPVLGVNYWGFNWEDPVIGGPKNVLLRKAIVQAIDREQINDQIYDGSRKPTDQLVPPGIPGVTTGLGLGVARNLEGAKKDFAAWKALGNELKEPLRFSFNAGAGWDKVSTIMIGNLKEAGIDARLDEFPADGTYFTKMRKGGGQIIRAGWFADYVLYDNFLFPLLHKASIDGDNLPRYSSDKFSNLVDQGRAAPNATAGAAFFTQAEKVALTEDVVLMPTLSLRGSVVFSSAVTNVKRDPLGFLNYESMIIK
jgi:oligopeptide transport system substrate-binding protein